jgi:hypothetical protein
MIKKNNKKKSEAFFVLKEQTGRQSVPVYMLG